MLNLAVEDAVANNFRLMCYVYGVGVWHRSFWIWNDDANHRNIHFYFRLLTAILDIRHKS